MDNTLKTFLQLTSAAALAATIVPSAMYLFGSLDLASAQWTMLGATAVWFIATPLWMGREKPSGEEVIP